MDVEVSVQDGWDTDTQADGVEFSVAVPTDPDADATLAPVTAAIWEEWFQRWLELVPPGEDGHPLHPQERYELSLRLMDDREIQMLNRQYRDKDQSTDVLAFAALEVDYPQFPELIAELPLYLGDIAISLETAARQAQHQGHSLQTELAWLAAHGLLHLLGWDHPDEESLVRMLQQQQFLLQAIGVTVQLE